MKGSGKIKKRVVIGASLVGLLFFIGSWYFMDRFSYSKTMAFYPVNSQKDTLLTIGIIGASWVAEGKMDSLLHNELLEKGISNSILSSGQPGATSKIIYQNLFKETAEAHSSKFIIEKRPDYCIVIGGVNDASAQMGGNFYVHHTLQIIKTLLHYKIRPIVIPVPEFGIKETIDSMGFFRKYRNILSAWFNNNGEIDNIRAYRNKLEKALAAEHLKDSIILVDFDKVCSDYHKNPELYSNPGHLSGKGYEKFCHIILLDLLNRMNI